jgi:hypothetical protein
MPQQCLGAFKLHTEREWYDGREGRVRNRLVHRGRRPVRYAMALHIVPGSVVVPVHDVSPRRSDLGGELGSHANADGGWPDGVKGSLWRQWEAHGRGRARPLPQRMH